MENRGSQQDDVVDDSQPGKTTMMDVIITGCHIYTELLACFFYEKFREFLDAQINVKSGRGSCFPCLRKLDTVTRPLRKSSSLSNQILHSAVGSRDPHLV